ncbi:hypothetical protein FZD47_02535 [Bacillus infantis]|uniref:Uncharacterized protein n=1 Tax=Bacillus infantis TaxID=324767 RepID=A0A5D4SST5_9BACI|nr:hypothetical protein [Bacillus infantis]TYS66383.1 hypothetical protein FZD47_02535 [Bacillus infantis]
MPLKYIDGEDSQVKEIEGINKPPSEMELLKEENLQIMLAQAETFEMIQRLDIEKSLAIAELAELVLGGGQ